MRNLENPFCVEKPFVSIFYLDISGAVLKIYDFILGKYFTNIHKSLIEMTQIGLINQNLLCYNLVSSLKLANHHFKYSRYRFHVRVN